MEDLLKQEDHILSYMKFHIYVMISILHILAANWEECTEHLRWALLSTVETEWHGTEHLRWALLTTVETEWHECASMHMTSKGLYLTLLVLPPEFFWRVEITKRKQTSFWGNPTNDLCYWLQSNSTLRTLFMKIQDYHLKQIVCWYLKSQLSDTHSQWAPLIYLPSKPDGRS